MSVTTMSRGTRVFCICTVLVLIGLFRPGEARGLELEGGLRREDHEIPEDSGVFRPVPIEGNRPRWPIRFLLSVVYRFTPHPRRGGWGLIPLLFVAEEARYLVAWKTPIYARYGI